jgi:hypothetical protein
MHLTFMGGYVEGRGRRREGTCRGETCKHCYLSQNRGEGRDGEGTGWMGRGRKDSLRGVTLLTYCLE